MAYKKYIQRNGKLYGPYIYQSKRVDGKVVSEYYGSDSNKGRNYKKILFIVLGVFLAAFLIYFFAFSNHKITGGVVIGADTSYESGKPLNGILKFSLKQGELIPESSKVVFENSGNSYEFPLIDVLNETLSEGNYYISGEEIQGEGLGYGIEGEKVVYPDVNFVLQIYNEVTGEEVAPVEATPEVVPTENTPVEPTTETTNPTTETTMPETTSNEGSSSPITGNVVKSSGGFFSSLFGLTGKVTMNLENEVDGVASKDKPFTYALKEGETAELKPMSVKIGDKELSDNSVSLKVENGEAIVTTDYSETQRGYGPDYIGNKEKVISLDLSNLNLNLEQGDLTIKLVYSGAEILQLTTNLKEGGKTSNETIVSIGGTEESNITPIVTEETNETIVANETVIPENVTLSVNVSNLLTDQEKEILRNTFGNTTLENTKSELYKDRIIMGYKFDKYYIEYSYDSSLSKEILDVQMENDRIKFLKDIANSILSEETVPKNIEGYNKTFTPF